MTTPTTTRATLDLLTRYYAAFNTEQDEALLALLSDDVVHDINQGGCEVGKDEFRAFLARMRRCYQEQIVRISLCASTDGGRGSAEYIVLGTYLEADEGLPPARKQTYELPGGAFFAIDEGLITRVTNYYNLQDWLEQVRA